MAGIYIHIPFCNRKCHYCNFFSLASQKNRTEFLTALKSEITQTRDYLAGEPVNTIYFGGGTPSLYQPEALQEVLEILAESPSLPDPKSSSSIQHPVSSIQHPVSNIQHPASSIQHPASNIQHPASNIQHPTSNIQHPASSIQHPVSTSEASLHPASTLKEITLEINPDNVTSVFVTELKHTWFNRFSVGVQSFFDEDLDWLNRAHSANQAIGAVRLLQEARYENISIDLIYGIPSSTDTRWQKNLETAFSLGVPHISAYALTVESGTPLAWMISKKRISPLDDELQVVQFKMLMEMALDHGFQQYEISNFARSGWNAIHNTNYWKGIPFLGLGPSAHSYNDNSRRWNVSNLSEYIERITNGACLYVEEHLTPEQKYNEYVMTSLRTMWGCDSQKLIYDFGSTIYDFFRKNALPMIDRGLLREVSGVYFLTDEGKLFADGVAAGLFLVT
ncbi:MAG: coproporphyrinogen III oxidase family protein [Bacteroidales bacterium]|nr:coproporphyrinogen III oxidase family protein [Bacteroidales bacterium]